MELNWFLSTSGWQRKKALFLNFRHHRYTELCKSLGLCLSSLPLLPSSRTSLYLLILSKCSGLSDTISKWTEAGLKLLHSAVLLPAFDVGFLTVPSCWTVPELQIKICTLKYSGLIFSISCSSFWCLTCLQMFVTRRVNYFFVDVETWKQWSCVWICLNSFSTKWFWLQTLPRWAAARSAAVCLTGSTFRLCVKVGL